MDIGTFLRQATDELQLAGISSARLDCLVLLEDLLEKERAVILAHTDDSLSPQQIEKLYKKIVQRKQHVPLAYIRGKAEFYGRTFRVTTDTLVPRPESENIITLACQDIPSRQRFTIADIGSGSGCLGITLGAERPFTDIYLCDIDEATLQVAEKNAKLHHVQVRTVQGSLFDVSPPGLFDVVLANLPYVPDDYPINAAAAYEPELALYSGKDGLDLYRDFWRQIYESSNGTPHYIYTESLPEQHVQMCKLAKQAGYTLRTVRDLVQAFKHD